MLTKTKSKGYYCILNIVCIVAYLLKATYSYCTFFRAHPALLEEGVNQGSPNKNRQTEQPNEKVNNLQNKDPGNDNNDKTDPNSDKDDDNEMNKKDDRVKADKTEPDCTDDAHSVAGN